MYTFKSTFFILLLGLALIVPAVYCFSVRPSLANREVVKEEQNDTALFTIIDVMPLIIMNGTTKDSSINDDHTTEHSSIDDDDASEDSSEEDDTSEDSSEEDDTSEDSSAEDSSVDDNDTTKDPSANNNETPSNGSDINSWPVIMIVEGESDLVNIKSESGSRRVDSVNNWLVVNKRTSLRRVEESSNDFGRNRKILSEDKNEELRIFRDNLHTVLKNKIDLANMLRM